MQMGIFLKPKSHKHFGKSLPLPVEHYHQNWQDQSVRLVERHLCTERVAKRLNILQLLKESG